MAKPDVRFESKKVEAFLARLDKNKDNVFNIRKAFAASIISPIMRDITKHFEDEMGLDGPWKPWSTGYAEQMARKGKAGNKILTDNRRLLQGLKETNWRKDPKGFLVFNNAKTKAGFPYAYAHNKGGPKLPKRKFMWISKRTFSQVAKTTSRFILAGKI